LLAKQIGSMFLMMFCGFLIIKLKLLTFDESKILNRLILFLIIPCAIVNAFQIDFTMEKLSGLGLAALASALVHVIYIVLARICRKPLKLSRVEEASVIYTNAGNLIMPLVSAVLGSEWLLYTVAYVVVQLVFLWTHAKNMICEETGFDLKKLLTNINIIAAVIGVLLFVFGIRLPDIAASAVSGISSMLGPACMLIIGMMIANVDLKSIRNNMRVFLIALVRLVIFSCVITVIFACSGLRLVHPQGTEILLVVLLSAVSCTGATVAQFAQLYGKDAVYASLINVVSVLFCIIFIPLNVFFYQALV